MYHEYCKAFLWPTFHYLGLTDHQSKEKQEHAWNAYYEANVAYAEKVAEVYKEGDLVSFLICSFLSSPLCLHYAARRLGLITSCYRQIWVQDYHLLLVPQLLRAKFPNAAIG
jgi:trehalose 6-phosphate synthase/phosphatase